MNNCEATSDVTPKACWWFHKWTRWEVEDGTATNRHTGKVRDALVQYRRCANCGFTQIENVRGR